jgi:hypothetical protein
VRRTSFDDASNICRKRARIAPEKEMDMIWLNSYLNDAPLVFRDHFLNDLLQPIMDGTMQYFLSPFWTENNMIDNQMNIMAIVLVFHVDTLPQINKSVQAFSACGRGLFIPGLKT